MPTSVQGTMPSSARRISCRALMPVMLCALAACQTRGTDRPFTSEVPLPPKFAEVVPTCNGAPARFALGQKMTPALLEEAKNRTGAQVAVTAKPGEALNPANPLRLIVEVDPAGQMVGARCG